ncbi:putative lipoprotein (plasmid) [Rhizobium tropici CIAT 899]|nr:putative lipoprotein [Rhizobium tropici CIAT 899]
MLARSLAVTMGLIAVMAVSGCQNKVATPQDLQGWYSMICFKHGYTGGARDNCMNSLTNSNGRQLPDGPTEFADRPPYTDSQMPNSG